jgi:hypothetical protein
MVSANAISQHCQNNNNIDRRIMHCRCNLLLSSLLLKRWGNVVVGGLCASWFQQLTFWTYRRLHPFHYFEILTYCTIRIKILRSARVVSGHGARCARYFVSQVMLPCFWLLRVTTVLRKRRRSYVVLKHLLLVYVAIDVHRTAAVFFDTLFWRILDILRIVIVQRKPRWRLPFKSKSHPA